MEIACEAMVAVSSLDFVMSCPSFSTDAFNADLWVFLVLNPDFIVDMMLSRDSSLSWTHFCLGNARSGASLSVAQYKSSLLAIATVSILLLVFSTHSLAGSQ